MSIGKLLRLRRKELEMTQGELSAKTGISAVSLVKYEHEKCLPSTKVLYVLAQALALDYDEVCEILAKEKNEKYGRTSI